MLSGLVVQSVTHADGHASFLSAISDGTWFDEGTLIDRGDWRYDAIALPETRVALLPLDTFEWLRETSLPFNHFFQSLMNARIAPFTRLVLSTRHASTESRVATAIANLFGPRDGPRSAFVRISQAELAVLDLDGVRAIADEKRDRALQTSLTGILRRRAGWSKDGGLPWSRR